MGRYALNRLLLLACLVCLNRLRELIGARRIAFATYARKQTLNFVHVFAFHKTSNTLQVAAATADKANVMHFVVCVYVKKDLPRTSALGRISKHRKNRPC